jgi:hypothetical protein
VTLVDEQSKVGGMLRLVEHTAAAPLAASVEFLKDELTHLTVDLRLGIRADRQVIHALHPDAVILATGATAFVPQLDGAERVGVVTSEHALTGPVGERVLVYDELGTAEGALVAEAVAKRGKSVVFATSHELVMPFSGALDRWLVPDILRKRLSRVYTSVRIGYVDGEKVFLVYADGDPAGAVEVDSVVAITSPVPNTTLVEELEALGYEYQVVGSAVAPRQATDAFREGEEAALRI